MIMCFLPYETIDFWMTATVDKQQESYIHILLAGNYHGYRMLGYEDTWAGPTGLLKKAKLNISF